VPTSPRFVTTQLCAGGAQGHHALGLAKRVKAHEFEPEIIDMTMIDENYSAAASVVSKLRVWYS